MFVCCVLSGRGLCDELITRPEESYRLWRVVVCDQETSCDEKAIARAGLQSRRNNNYYDDDDDNNSNNNTVFMTTYVRLRSLARIVFVTETVFYVRHVLRSKNVSLKKKDCVLCEVRTEIKETDKHRA
jgi:hypothetical protein